MISEIEDFERYRIGDLIVDIAGQRVTRNGQEIALPNLSFDLLQAMVGGLWSALGLLKLPPIQVTRHFSQTLLRSTGEEQ